MNASHRNLFLLSALIAGLSLIPANRATAQAFTPLHNFTATSGPDATNSDGLYARELILSSNTIYGEAYRGGSADSGTVFAVNTDGSNFTNLHTFTGTPGPSYTNSDGAAPQARLILLGSTLYGTAYAGGSSGNGTIFAVGTDGTGFTNLYNFTATPHYPLPSTNGDGANPLEMILSSNTLYGVAQGGGNFGDGTVFAINVNGTGFTNLHSFDWTNGADPSGLTLVGNILYGTTYNGGSSNSGTVFAVNTDGTGFTNLHCFSARNNLTYANGDGAYPSAGLVSSGNVLYGTARAGGSSADGTVFAINADGTGFKVLHSFTAHSFYGYTNSDGVYPNGLILSGNTLYGTAFYGGSSGHGTVFAVDTDGSGFKTLHSFTSASFPYYTNYDGAGPEAGLILSGNTLYGTTDEGGSLGSGTLFSLFILPQLTIFPSDTKVVLSWPTNAVGFNLQSAPDITGTFTNIPGAASPFTNSISGPQMFFWLSQ